jgi:hypothetical protein
MIKFRYVSRCYIAAEFNSKILFTIQKKVFKLMISTITRASQRKLFQKLNICLHSVKGIIGTWGTYAQHKFAVTGGKEFQTILC